MVRPTGWDVLGLGSDPTPGDPESVRSLAKQLGDFAHDVERAYTSLNSFGADANAMEWVGQTAEAFKGQFGPLPGRLQKLYTSYSEASDALSAYFPALQNAQSKADSALRQAQDAEADLQRAQTNANTAATDLKTAQQNHAASPNPQAVTDAQTAHDSAQTNLKNAQDRMSGLAAQANQAHHDLEDAAKQCAKALHHAQSDGIHNKHWWEHVGEFLSEWGGKIAEIANDLAPFLDVLALATSWIPGVDVITAGLAEADNLIALAGTGLKIAGDAMQGHWGDALMGAGMLGATLLGGKAISKLGGKAFESLSSKFGNEAKNADNTLGNEVRGAEGKGPATCERDPIDVVSGQLLMDEVDLRLPGVLPVVLSRTYASGYEYGRLFGPGWSSTLDQRLSVNAAGIHFVGDDAQTLHYPIPEPGEDVLPLRGARWPLAWDRESDEIRIADPWSGLTWCFATVHGGDTDVQIRDVTAIRDRNGGCIRILRDENGTPTGLEHPAYRLAIETAVIADGPRVTAIRLQPASSGEIAIKTYRYDDRGRLVGIVDSSGRPYIYEHDDADRITAWIDRLGYRYTYEYDNTGRVIRTAGDGSFMDGSFAYDTMSRTTEVTDSLGNVTTYQYDEHGHIAAVTDPLGTTTLTEYDRHGRLLSRTDGLGARTIIDVDESGDPIRTVAADGGITEATYDDCHRVIRFRGTDGGEWLREYDDLGNLTTVTNPLGAVERYLWAADGALVGETDATGVTSSYETDAAGLPITVVDPLGATTRARRDAFGRIVEVVDPLGATTRYGWTVEGRPAWRIDADGGRTEWRYDAQGTMTALIDPVGTVTRYEPGPFSRIVARTDPDGVRHVFDYDSELRLTAAGVAGGPAWRYAYDAAGRLTTEYDLADRPMAYEYDPLGRMTARTSADGRTIRFEHDALGRVTRRHTPDGSYAYEFDVGGRLQRATGPGTSVEYTRDPVGRILSETVDGRTMRFEYDAAGRRVRRVSATGVVSSWSFDPAGRVAALEAGTGSLNFGYDPAGRETERHLGGGARLTRESDAIGRRTAQRLWTGDRPGREGQAALTREWVWRPDGLPVEIRDSLRGARRFGFDAAGRVNAVSTEERTEQYAYDDLGYVLTAVSGNETDGAEPIADESPANAEAAVPYPGLGGAGPDRASRWRRYRTVEERDAAGRLVRSTRRTLDGRRRVTEYRWDAADHLVELVTPDGERWTYTYDVLGRRATKVRAGAGGRALEETVFAWDGPRVAEERTTRADGSVRALTWDYDPGTFRPAAQRSRTWACDAEQDVIDEVFHAIVTDLVGTPTELVTSDGHVAWHITSDLWGRTVGVAADADTDCPLRFPGQYHDAESGLHYNLNRYYDPDEPGYLTPDLLGQAPAAGDRAYVSNPLVFIDPLGLSCTPGGNDAESAANWVTEGGDLSLGRTGMRSQDAYDFQSGTPGARSDVATRRALAPELSMPAADGTSVTAKFDGVSGNEIIDRKINPYFTDKAVDLARRQAATAAYHGLTPVYEVPDQVTLDAMNRFMKHAKVTTIVVRIGE